MDLKQPQIKVSPPGPKSLSLIKSMKNVIGQGNYMGLYGVCISKSQGSYIEDVDGNIYLDCMSGAASNNLGYNFHQIPNIYHKVAKTISHTSFSYSPTKYPVELAENLVRITPGNHDKKALLGLCGSKSCEDAIEIIWKYTNRKKIIKFKNAYHGATWLTKSVSGFVPENSNDFNASCFVNLPYPTSEQTKDYVLKQVKLEMSQNNIGGVLIEPILADAGIVQPCPGFFSSLYDMLQQNKALLAVDEIQSGMGRTGKWWCIEHENIVPDLIITGKALGAGYCPISALVGKAEIIDSIEAGKQIGTFIGHPPSSAAAIETIKVIEENDLVNNAGTKGKKLLTGLHNLTKQFPKILLKARGRGLLIGLEINVSDDKQACKIFATRCAEKGIYFGYLGISQEVLRIAPPLTINDYEINIIINTIKEVAMEMKSNSIPDATIKKANKYAIGLVIIKT